MKIDVCVVTKSRSNAKYIIDKFSRASFVNNIIIETSKPLGLARKRAIGKVTTEWFAFIDDDVVIPDPEKWFLEIKQHIAPGVGAIEGTDLLVGLGKKWDTSIKQFRLLGVKTPIKLSNSTWTRGYTINTLIRTELVTDWTVSNNNLEAFEDLELTKHIQKKGYVWLKVGVTVLHLKTWKQFFKNSLWLGRTLTYCNLFTNREKSFKFLDETVYFLKVALNPTIKFPFKFRWAVCTASHIFFEFIGFFSNYFKLK